MAKSKSSYSLMSLISVTALVVALVGLAIAVMAVQQKTSTRSGATGNGAPSGYHYNLNIIGVSNTANFSGGKGAGGKVIFVPLSGSCKINLQQGLFQVIDGNCVDDGSANFQLPAADPTNTGTTTYSVWVRALGKPGGSSTTTTCATDPITNEVYCSLSQSVQTRTKGKSTFTNVSKELLYIYQDIDGDGRIDRVPLFDSRLQDYYWQYDNNKLKVLQLRFYYVPTTVPGTATATPAL